MDLEIFSTKNKLMDSIFPEVIASINSVSGIRYEISTLAKILLSNFVIHQGCYLLEFTLPEDFSSNPDQVFTRSNFADRTGYECYENHLHTIDIIKGSQPGIHHLLTGIIIADNLRYKLKAMFPSTRFRIIVSFPVLPLSADDDEIKNDCTIRFHLVRDGEYIFDNLDDFKFEAMGVIEV